MSDSHSRKNLFAEAMDRLGDLFILNLLFIAFSLPIVTIGASTTALYSVTIKMQKKEEGTLSSSFIASFKSNFKAATKLWFLIILAVLIMFVQYVMIINYHNLLSKIYIPILIAELVVFAITLPFIFPLEARYTNTIKGTVKNAFILSFANLWSGIRINIAWAAPILLSVIYPKIFLFTWYLWIVIGFSLISYIASAPALAVFNKIEEKNNNTKNKQ